MSARPAIAAEPEIRWPRFKPAHPEDADCGHGIAVDERGGFTLCMSCAAEREKSEEFEQANKDLPNGRGIERSAR